VAVTRPKVRDDLTVVELDGEAVIYDEISGELHHLNPSATLAFGLFDGTATVRVLATDLSEAFGIPVEEMESQLRTLVREFRKLGLMNGSKRTSDA
jgi:PqqD family protein of HPr-rel-A system